MTANVRKTIRSRPGRSVDGNAGAGKGFARLLFEAAFRRNGEDDAAHRSDVRQLRESSNDVTDGIDARLCCLLRFVDLDKSSIDFDACLVETDIGDYEKVAGVYLPFSIESGRKGDPDKQKIVIDKAEPNVPVDETIFKFPVSK